MEATDSSFLALYGHEAFRHFIHHAARPREEKRLLRSTCELGISPPVVIGVAFMEAMVPPALPRSFMPPENSMFHRLRNPEIGPKIIYEQNFFVETVLPGAVVRDLTEQEMAYYRAPYVTPESRKPTLVWPNEVPFADGPQRNVDLVNRYGAWMSETDMPFLLLYVSPGAIISPELAAAMVERYRNIESHYLGIGRHFIQEDHPHKIGRAVADWRRRVLAGK